MNEGIRFDLTYETMPWHKIDTVVFDIGNVLIRYAPDDFVRTLFPGDEAMQRRMLTHVFGGKYWKEFDRGTMRYEEAARLLASEHGGAEEDYLRALYGWIELKTPLEEGWRAAERCKRAGKKIVLLSNYPREGYEVLRTRYGERFDLFDGGIISCLVGQIKPEPAIYRTLMDTCGVEAGRAVFIDDLLENVEGAMKAGIHGFRMDEKGKMDRFFI